MIHADSESGRALKQYDYHKKIRTINSSGEMDKLYWDLGNKLFAYQQYQAAIEILTKIPEKSELFKVALHLRRACKLSIGGYHTYSTDDLNLDPKIEEAAIKIQAFCRSRACFFKYKSYKLTEKEILSHIQHGRIQQAKEVMIKLEAAAAKFFP